jgi:NADH-quinone oxidoreductase subunit E
MAVLADAYGEEIKAILAKYPDRRSAVLPLMYLAQEAYGFLSKDAIIEVANSINMEPTEVLSLAGFYTLFYEEPVGKFVLEICNDLPCALRGADEFVEMACQKLKIAVGETTEDGLFSLKTVMCLAACDRAPMMQVNLKYEEYLDEEKFDAIIANLREHTSEDDPRAFGVEAFKRSLTQE